MQPFLHSFGQILYRVIDRCCTDKIDRWKLVIFMQSADYCLATSNVAEELEKLMTSRRRPSKLADALTRKAYRDYNRVQTGAHVKWVPNITAALDEAEALGKKQA